MKLDYLKLVVSGMKQRKLRSWLTMIGIFIGIAAVVSLIGLGEGLRVAITSQFGFLGSDVLSIQAEGLALAGPPGSGTTSTPLTDDLTDKISKVPNVETAFNRFISSGSIEFNDKQVISLIASVPGGEERKIYEKMLNLKMEDGRFLKEGDGKKIVLGSDFGSKDTFEDRKSVV